MVQVSESEDRIDIWMTGIIGMMIIILIVMIQILTREHLIANHEMTVLKLRRSGILILMG